MNLDVLNNICKCSHFSFALQDVWRMVVLYSSWFLDETIRLKDENSPSIFYLEVLHLPFLTRPSITN